MVVFNSFAFSPSDGIFVNELSFVKCIFDFLLFSSQLSLLPIRVCFSAIREKIALAFVLLTSKCAQRDLMDHFFTNINFTEVLFFLQHISVYPLSCFTVFVYSNHAYTRKILFCSMTYSSLSLSLCMCVWFTSFVKFCI